MRRKESFDSKSVPPARSPPTKEDLLNKYQQFLSVAGREKAAPIESAVHATIYMGVQVILGLGLRVGLEFYRALYSFACLSVFCYGGLT